MAGSGSETLFDVAVKTPKGQRAGTYATAVCGCGATADVFAKGTASGATLPAEPLARKFRNLGWLIGKRKGKHTCPACRAPLAPVPKADPPPEPTPENRRAVLEALEIVFCPAKGFDEGYDDERVAAEQGVPRRWVTDIREQFIGPVPAPRVDHIAEARAGLKRLAEAGVALSDAVEAVNRARLRIAELQADICKHLDSAGDET